MKIIPHRPDKGQNYKNPFKELNMYPFSKIGRVAVNKDTAEIRHWLNEMDSTLDDKGNPVDFTDLDIYTYVPKFYAKREWVGEVLSDEISTEIPTEKVKDGWEIHPAFIRPDGTVRDYILIASFPATEVGGQLRSVPSGTKPLVSLPIGTFMSKARQGRSNKFSVHNPQSITVLQLLYKVAFQTLYLQDYIGNGWVGKQEAPTVGTTMKLGNRTGYLGVNGDDISIFGIEKPWGGIWEFVTGIYATDEGYRITNDSAKFGGASSTYDLVATTPLMGVNANEHVEGWVKKMLKIDGTHKYWNIPKELGGGSNTYYTDYFWSHRRTQENICLFGAAWDLGAHAGAFCLSLSLVASISWSHLGARLVYLP